MILNPVTDGSKAGTGTAIFDSGIVGGVLITADGTNATTVTIQANNSSGKTVFQISTKSPIFVTGPIGIFDINGVQVTAGYYSVTGTGGAAQFFEWKE